MICYKDMTFCNYYRSCTNGRDCRRALTKQIKQNGAKWSKQYHPTDILICKYTEKPKCFEGK